MTDIQTSAIPANTCLKKSLIVLAGARNLPGANTNMSSVSTIVLMLIARRILAPLAICPALANLEIVMFPMASFFRPSQEADRNYGKIHVRSPNLCDSSAIPAIGLFDFVL